MTRNDCGSHPIGGKNARTVNQFARTTPRSKIPTLLRRIARDISYLNDSDVIDIAVFIDSALAEATVTVYVGLDSETDPAVAGSSIPAGSVALGKSAEDYANPTSVQRPEASDE